MSDSTPPAPWEEATMELRQVMGTVTEGRLDETRVVVGVQRKWLVQDGEAYPLEWVSPPRAPTDRCIHDPTLEGFFPWYAPVRAEWRDLPQIGAGEVETVLR